MNRIMRSGACALLMVALSAIGARGIQHEHTDYIPLSRAELGKPFRLKFIGEFDSEHPISTVGIGLSGAQLQFTDQRSVMITGRDAAGKPWSVESWVGVLNSGSLYVGDLDRNGIADAVLIVSTGGNGLAPSRHIKTIMFDSSGRPVFFEADGYFRTERDGIAELVDMDGEGRAELVHMNFDDGYWITNVYKAVNARWQKVAGRLGRRDFPLFTRFTYRPNHTAVSPMRGRHPFGPDLSDNAPRLTGRLISYKWADVEQSGNILLSLKKANGNAVACRPDSWYSSFSVTIDSKQNRRIASLGSSDDSVRSLLNEIVAKGYDVSLFGQRTSNSCSPELLWASPRGH
jgi:hypothetical protein